MGNRFSADNRTSYREVASQLGNPGRQIIIRRPSCWTSTHLEKLIKIIETSSNIKKLIIEVCFCEPDDTFRVLEAIESNNDIKALHLSLSQNKYDENCIEKLKILITNGKIKSLTFPHEVKATHANDLLEAVYNGKNDMGILKLEDCELDSGSLDWLKKIIDRNKVKGLFCLRHCTAAGEDGQKKLLTVEELKELREQLKKRHTFLSPWQPLSRFKLFQTEPPLSDGREIEAPSGREQRAFVRVLLKPTTGTISVLLFKHITEAEEARYRDANYQQLLSADIQLDVRANEKIKIVIDGVEPGNLIYKSAEEKSSLKIDHTCAQSKDFICRGLTDTMTRVECLCSIRSRGRELIKRSIAFVHNPKNTDTQNNKVDVKIENTQNTGLSNHGRIEGLSQGPLNIGRGEQPGEEQCSGTEDDTLYRSATKQRYSMTESEGYGSDLEIIDTPEIQEEEKGGTWV